MAEFIDGFAWGENSFHPPPIKPMELSWVPYIYNMVVIGTHLLTSNSGPRLCWFHGFLGLQLTTSCCGAAPLLAATAATRWSHVTKDVEVPSWLKVRARTRRLNRDVF